MKIIIIILSILAFIMSSCYTQKGIKYALDSNEKTRESLDSIPFKLASFSPKRIINNHKIYALIIAKDTSIKIYFEYYSNLPDKELIRLIKSSNRYLLVNDRKIPLIFLFDTYSLIFGKGKDRMFHFRISGYLIEIDNMKDQNIKYEGIVY